LVCGRDVNEEPRPDEELSGIERVDWTLPSLIPAEGYEHCPRCGAACGVSPLCSRCGEVVKPISRAEAERSGRGLTCLKCGYENPRDRGLCLQCGERL
ncbi:MAG: hypothetical protein AAFQ82_24635, partial [Myxococcota bacterium]